jgi:hypothetical protein
MNPWDFSSRTDFNSVTWQDAAPSHCSNAGLGWRVSLGAVGYFSMATSQVCVPPAIDKATGCIEAP